jgi:uncharacterized HAD superfamily protein
MRHLVVQCDVDGVLADFTTAFRREARRYDSGISLEHHAWPFDLDIPKGIVNMVWSTIKANPGWWAGVEGLPLILEWDRLGDLVNEHDVYFVTARPGPQARLATVAWLEDQEIVAPVVIRASDKAAIARAIGATHSIEDHPGNALAIAQQGPRSYLLDQPWNRGEDHGLVTRVTTLDAFLDAVA